MQSTSRHPVESKTSLSESSRAVLDGMLANNPLLEHLLQKNPNGIPLEDAKKLYILIFCTLRVVPTHLRHLVLDKFILAHVFNGLWVADALTEVPVGTQHIDWVGLVREYLLNQFQLEKDFPYQKYI